MIFDRNNDAARVQQWSEAHKDFDWFPSDWLCSHITYTSYSFRRFLCKCTKMRRVWFWVPYNGAQSIWNQNSAIYYFNALIHSKVSPCRLMVIAHIQKSCVCLAHLETARSVNVCASISFKFFPPQITQTKWHAFFFNKLHRLSNVSKNDNFISLSAQQACWTSNNHSVS